MSTMAAISASLTCPSVLRSLRPGVFRRITHPGVVRPVLGRSELQVADANSGLKESLNVKDGQEEPGVVVSKLSAEAVPLLYASITFRFDSINVINRFLGQASPEGIKSISKLVLLHAAYGEPAKQENGVWKVKYDKRWAEACKRIAEEVVALEHLKLSLEISDWPTQLNLAAKWAKPLLVLKGEGLDRVDVILKHSRFLKQRLLSAARMIEKGMMKEEGVQKKQREAGLAATKQLNGPDGSGRKTPKAVKVLLITATTPAPK